MQDLLPVHEDIGLLQPDRIQEGTADRTCLFPGYDRLLQALYPDDLRRGAVDGEPDSPAVERVRLRRVSGRVPAGEFHAVCTVFREVFRRDHIVIAMPSFSLFIRILRFPHLAAHRFHRLSVPRDLDLPGILQQRIRVVLRNDERRGHRGHDPVPEPVHRLPVYIYRTEAVHGKRHVLFLPFPFLIPFHHGQRVDAVVLRQGRDQRLPVRFLRSFCRGRFQILFRQAGRRAAVRPEQTEPLSRLLVPARRLRRFSGCPRLSGRYRGLCRVDALRQMAGREDLFPYRFQFCRNGPGTLCRAFRIGFLP